MVLKKIKEELLKVIKKIKEKLLKVIKKIKEELLKVISSKIDVTNIINEHYQSLYNNRTDRKIKDLFTFFGIPLIVSGILVFFAKGTLDKDVIEPVLTSLSIFTPIMFSLLVAIFSINRKRLTKPKTYDVIKEFKANVSFLIIVSLISIFLLIIDSMNLWDNQWYVACLSFIILFFLGVIGLTLLQVLKRWNYLLDETLKEIKPPKEKIF